MDIYKGKGITLKSGNYIITNTNITNSYFENGFLYYTNKWAVTGFYTIQNILFENNTSYRGTFLYYDDIKGGDVPLLSISNIKFINNKATNYGGIIYSNARDDSLIGSIQLKYCEFINNTAVLGIITINIIHNIK